MIFQKEIGSQDVHMYKNKRTYLMPGTANNGREDGTRSIIPSETGLAHTGAIVNNQSSNFIIHGCLRNKE